MNPTIPIPLAFVRENFILSWNEVLWGYRNSFFNNRDIVTFALDAVQRSTEPFSPQYGLEMRLAGLLQDELHEVELLLSKLSSDLAATSDTVADKWLYIIMYWLYENRSTFHKIQDTIDKIYADFNHPESIRPIVGYMPNYEPTNSSSVEDWISRRDANWTKYLKGFGFYLKPI